MVKKLLMIMLLAGVLAKAEAQELQGKVTVIAARVSTQTDKKIFQTLQTALNNFIFNRKWTKDEFKQQERIRCNFLLNIETGIDQNTYRAALTVQAARPVYNSSYESPLVNFIDDNVSFKYVEYQAVDFNENRISGSDPMNSNLSAVFAYYVYTILGMDYDSFSLRGGDPYFQKALNIVTNAPEGRDITGWKAFDGLRNRYWLAENLTNSRYGFFHEAIYNYYRLGFDNFYENEPVGRTAMLNCLGFLNNVNNENPNTMFIQFFFQGKSNEIIQVLKKGQPEEKSRAVEILQRLDIANAATYKKELN
jgi:Domain of unknown function (DUF4835)